MQRKELTFDVIEVLQGLVDKFLPELVRKTREVLGAQEMMLFNAVFEQDYQKEKVKGRWYDRYHIPLDVLFSAKAVKLGQAPPETVPAGINHDRGYLDVDPKLRIGGENKEDLLIVHSGRILHMQKAASPTAKILMEHGYSPDKICRILDVVVSHDDGLIGLPIPEDPLFLAVRDGDRTLPMHLISFYKDWIGITNQQKDFSLLQLFRSRLIAFYDANDSAPAIWGIPGRLTKEDEFCLTHDSLRVPYTPLAKEWRDRQFEARWQEIQSDILRDENSFRQYAEKHIRAELKAGRG